MKKGLLIGLIIGGAVLLTVGAVIFTVGVVNSTKSSKLLNNEYDVSSYSKINIDIDTADLEFIVSEVSADKVVVNEKEKQYHTVEVIDDTLNIKGYDSRKWYEHAFDFNFKPMRITVYTSAVNYDNVYIKSSTGDINIPADYTFNNVEIKVSTGNIKFKSKINENINITSSTGDVSLETSAKKINIESSTGKIKLNNTIAEEIKIKSSTGDVSLIDSDASSLIDIHTSTGDVNAVLLTGKTFEVETSTGVPKVPGSTVGAPICRIKTSTGDIKVTIK